MDDGVRGGTAGRVSGVGEGAQGRGRKERTGGRDTRKGKEGGEQREGGAW